MCRISVVVFFLILVTTFCKKTEQIDSGKKIINSYCGKESFTVAFYNVQNMFDLEYSGSEYKEYKPGVSNWNRDMMKQKMDNIASVLLAINAEIIGLCEVENLNVLSKMQKVLENKGLVYKHIAIADSPVKSNTCPAILSRYPLRDSRGIGVVLESGKTRNILETDVLIGGSVLKIFVNHWPSKINPESWRLQSAKVLESRIKELPENSDYVLIGDFNSDYDDHWKIATSGTDDLHGLTGVHSVLGTVIECGMLKRYTNELDMVASVKNKHYDLWLELKESVRMSHFFRGNHQTPDHILISSALYDSSGISYVDNSFNVFTWGDRLLEKDKPLRWKIYEKKGVKLHTGKGFSDHLPIRASFRIGPFRTDTELLSSAQKNEYDKQYLSCWMLCNSDAELLKDTSNYLNYGYSMCLRMESPQKNGCVARMVVDNNKFESEGISFYILGHGRICLRTRCNGNKWSYLDVNSLKCSTKANYQSVNFKKWKKIIVEKNETDLGNLEVEIRNGKGEPFCFWLDYEGFNSPVDLNRCPGF